MTCSGRQYLNKYGLIFNYFQDEDITDLAPIVRVDFFVVLLFLI